MPASDVLCRLERRIGGVRAGSASYVYALGAARASAASRGRAPDATASTSPRATSSTTPWQIAELVVDLQRLPRVKDASSCSTSRPSRSCWRRFARGLDGPRVLKPDLAVALRLGEYEYHWFVEIDLATHSAAAVVRKCQLYHRYWADRHRAGAQRALPQGAHPRAERAPRRELLRARDRQRPAASTPSSSPSTFWQRARSAPHGRQRHEPPAAQPDPHRRRPRGAARRCRPDSVDCVITSPPYFRLRNYQDERQIGLEAARRRLRARAAARGAQAGAGAQARRLLLAQPRRHVQSRHAKGAQRRASCWLRSAWPWR